ncbi:MAG: hypothetical protein SPJ13_03690 [Bacteroidales bacterium]|nr:hypothetical protein [Bacteroidales bacterium]
MNQDLFDNELRRELQNITCSRQVDVVDRVMEQVTKQQSHVNTLSPRRWRIAIGAVAACGAIVVAVGFTLVQKNVELEENVGYMVNSVTAYVDDYFAENENDAKKRFEYIEDFTIAGEDVNK